MAGAGVAADLVAAPPSQGEPCVGTTTGFEPTDLPNANMDVVSLHFCPPNPKQISLL